MNGAIFLFLIYAISPSSFDVPRWCAQKVVGAEHHWTFAFFVVLIFILFVALAGLLVIFNRHLTSTFRRLLSSIPPPLPPLPVGFYFPSFIYLLLLPTFSRLRWNWLLLEVSLPLPLWFFSPFILLLAFSFLAAV
jgi:hypothetical protein